MIDPLDARIRRIAVLAVVLGIGLAIAADLIEDPDSSWLDATLNLLEMTPIVLSCVGLAVLAQVASRQRDEHREVLQQLEDASIEGQHWRQAARGYLDGLGEAIDSQFASWKLTPAEREVALLFLKGLSSKEVASVRRTSERTVREQARCVYAKAGLSGRTALSAFFLEDLLAPTNEIALSNGYAAENGRAAASGELREPAEARLRTTRC